MAAIVAAGQEARAFRDIPTDKIELLEFVGSQALIELREADKLLQESEQSQPVLSVSTGYTEPLPYVWMGIGMSEPEQGLRHIEDTKYHPRPNAPSLREAVHGLAVPVLYESVSTVKFFPYTLSEHEEETSSGWWEHWQHHRVTQQAGSYRRVRDFEDEIALGPKLFASWLKQTPLEQESGISARFATPEIITEKAKAARINLVPMNLHGRYLDWRHRAAIFVGGDAIQAVLDDSSRLGVIKENAPEPFHKMMTTAATELGLEYTRP